MKIKLPELLSPAGNPGKLRAAFAYGADAVYLAGRRFGMRAAADNFSETELKWAVEYAHSLNKKVYAAVNIMPRGGEYAELALYLEQLGECSVDALICADLGVIALVKDILPEIDIHVSTQASVVSSRAAEQYLKLGCRRVVLARELTLDEITRLRAETSRELELEAFVHGSMCVSYSGRCLLSNYFTGRDANRGECAQPCRWIYRTYALEEDKRPGVYMPVEEDSHGTSFMSSRDMCMLRYVPELCNAGIDSFKIEGRMKSEYYTAVTANCYRIALDSYASAPDEYIFDERLWEEVESVSHREYGTGFYFNAVGEDASVCNSPGYIRDKAYLAVASEQSDLPRSGLYRFIQRNKFRLGDTITLISPGMTGRSFVAEELYNSKGEIIESTPHPLMEFWLGVPFDVKEGDILRG